jgi:hypothetical protein
MKWTGLWNSSGGDSTFRCLHMVAWETLSAVDVAGVVGGQFPDGAQGMQRFFVKLDASGGFKHLVLDNLEVIFGKAIEFDKLDVRILEITRKSSDLIASMHESAEWEIGQSLVLRAESEKSLRSVSTDVLMGGEAMDALITRVVEAAGVTLATPAESQDVDSDAFDDAGHSSVESAGEQEPTGYRYFRGTVARIPDNWSPATNEDDNGLIGIGLPPLDDDGSPNRVIFRCFISPTEFRWEADCAGNVERDSGPADELDCVGVPLLAVTIALKLGAATTTTLAKDLKTLIQGYANGGDDVYRLASMLDDENWRCDIGPDDAINFDEDDRVDDVPGGFVVEIYPDCNVPEDVFEQGANDIEWFYQDNRDMDRHFFGIRFAEVLEDEDEEGISLLTLQYEQSTYELGVHETSLAIGRDTACELVVTEQPVSRRHAKIERRGDGFVLIDQSTNGTWLCQEGEDEIVLRKEEAPLIGHGTFSLGHPAKEGLPSVAYFIT